MGGMGSGTWYRWSKQTTVDQVKRIDIRYMKKQGLLKPNRKGRLSWTNCGEPTGSIRYSSYQDYLSLSFRYQRYGEDWQQVEQHVTFDKTTCHFGGERLWFLCPRCSMRVAVLYVLNKFFLCRHCNQLPYSSQNDSEMDNLIQQMHKLGERIFEHYESGEGWGKKKGMHWKTFKRLHIRFTDYEERCGRLLRQNGTDLSEFDMF